MDFIILYRSFLGYISNILDHRSTHENLIMEFSDSSIFDISPTPMWIEDYSEVREQFNQWKGQGITNLQSFLE